MGKWKRFYYPKLQRTKRFAYSLLYRFYSRRPLKADHIIMATNRSTELTGNLRYIYEGLQGSDYTVDIFILHGKSAPRLTRLKNNLHLIRTMAQTKYTLIDDFVPLLYPLKIRKGAHFIQVWHAIGAFKRVGYSRIGKRGGPVETSISHKNYTDAIVSSESIRGNYAEAFGIDVAKVHATGVPRSDLFFREQEMAAITDRLYEEYPQFLHKRVILYAPTFRGRGKNSAHFPDSYLEMERLYEALPPDTVFVLKMHPFVRRRPEIPPSCADRIFDLTDYPEVNHLLLISDLLITDYSSVIFEYALLKRPIIFYVPDLDDYRGDRDFYYDFTEYIFGEVCNDFEELLGAIVDTGFHEEQNRRFCQKFLDRCDGHATTRFIETIFRD